jgi:hypothetical protein
LLYKKKKLIKDKKQFEVEETEAPQKNIGFRDGRVQQQQTLAEVETRFGIASKKFVVGVITIWRWILVQ